MLMTYLAMCSAGNVVVNLGEVELVKRRGGEREESWAATVLNWKS
jgi:hypothetical protein